MNLDFTFSPELAKTFFSLSLTILIAIIVNHILHLFIKVPKSFDTRRSRTYVSILRNIITVIVYATALYIIFIELGVNITPLLASAGVLTIIIGLGARAMIEDLISGLFLLSQDSIAIGDYVKIDDAEGTIEEINFRTLIIRGDNGATYIIPNGQIKKLVNFSRQKARLQIDIPVKADQDITRILKALEEALTQLQKDKELGEAVSPNSKIDGIEEFKPVGPIVVRATVITSPTRRFEVARAFRLLVKKSMEKHKLLLG